MKQKNLLKMEEYTPKTLMMTISQLCNFYFLIYAFSYFFNSVIVLHLKLREYVITENKGKIMKSILKANLVTLGSWQSQRKG